VAAPRWLPRTDLSATKRVNASSNNDDYQDRSHRCLRIGES
jgi:hypothetical protein